MLLLPDTGLQRPSHRRARHWLSSRVARCAAALACLLVPRRVVATVVGVILDPEMLKRANQLARERKANAAFELAGKVVLFTWR